MKRVEKGWMVAGVRSRKPKLYYGPFKGTRKGSVEDHCHVIGENWEKCKRRGDRAVEVTITYEYPEGK